MRISLRGVVRLALADAAGRTQNQYPALAMVDGPASEQPCAVLLTDEQGCLNLVVSYLNRGYGDGDVVRHTGQLTGRLEQLRMWRTVARSKPSGASHAWLSLTEPTDADLLGALADHTAALADHTAALLPTPDVAPLRNSAPTRRRRLAQRCDSRRAYRYLIAATATIAGVDPDRTAAAPAARVAVIMRLPPLLRSGLERRAAAESAASMNSYLESLVIRDLAAPVDRAFEVFVETTCNARGTRGGRPAKGPRSVILLRVDPSIRERIHSRAAALGLRVNVYFESLVSQDISAAAPAREEMALDQTA